MVHNVVYTAGGGRLGNQLLNYANLLAFDMEYDDFWIVDLPFLKYTQEYAGEKLELCSKSRMEFEGSVGKVIRFFWRDDPIGDLLDYYPLEILRLAVSHRIADQGSDSQSIIGGHPHIHYRLTGDHFDQFDLTKTRNLMKLRSKDISLLAGWGTRAWTLVEKHRSKIRILLQPDEKYYPVAESHISSIRDTFDMVVGLLIRQTDYQSWHDGRYYFGSDRYRQFLDEYTQGHSDKNIGYVIASDEQQSEALFDDDRFYFATGKAVGSGHYMENFVELSLCDAVITPPSTFSVFAAFLGDIPIIPLYDSVLENGWERLKEPLIKSRTHPHMAKAIK